MLVGRNEEIQRFEKVYRSKEAEFVVVYGRRRVGKTFLIREFFQNKKATFLQTIGVQKGGMAIQLQHFSEALSKTFTNGIPIKTPTSWEEAFKTLTQFIDAENLKTKTVLFLDELPWMATPRSGLLEAINYYWNQYWSTNPRIILIICGSSASWLIKKVIYNRGGLHNRCTCEIRLAPFNLKETQEFFISRNIHFTQKQILELYMAFGGIPYYLKYVEKSLTAAENIQAIMFNKKAPLKDEFKKLFDSLFTEASVYIEIIEKIAERKEGISRAILEASIHGGGRLTDRLKQLEQTNFINAYVPWERERGEYYKVVDEFCLFYLSWMKSNQSRRFTQDHWLQQKLKPAFQVWAGYAFEAICQKHIEAIIKALKIQSADSIGTWRLITHDPQEKGAQIDLLIDRNDDAITLCEIKFTEKAFVINKQYAENLRYKITAFKDRTQTKKQIFMALISARGIKLNKYSDELISHVVTEEDLFI